VLAAGEVPAVSEVVFLLDNDPLVSHFPAVAPVRAAAPDPEYPQT
jgi:hypothetical protein